MKNNRIVVCSALFLLFCLFSALVVSASRPSRAETIRNLSFRTLRALGQAIDALSVEQLAEMTGSRSGVRLVDGKMLKYLMDHDENVLKNPVYDDVLKLELETPPCRYYCVFNLSLTEKTRSFCLLDTTSGFLYEADDPALRGRNPRELFKEICILFGVEESFKTYCSEFLEETEQRKNLQKAVVRDSGLIGFLARYWWAVVLSAFLDFFFVDLKYMKGERSPVKLYAMGSYLVGAILGLSMITIFYTGTPVPDLKDFGRLMEGSFPKELRLLSDVILVASFGWWAVSIPAVFLAGKFNWSPLIPLFFVVGGPLAFASSESPFGGPQKMALPAIGFLMMWINAFYIKKKYSK